MATDFGCHRPLFGEYAERWITERAVEEATQERCRRNPPVDVLDVHLDKYVGPEPEALVYTGAKRAALRRGNWRKSVKWADRIAVVGLMRRMGHSSVRAALIYQHATDDRDQEIAKALNMLIEAEKLAGGDADRTGSGDDDDGSGEAPARAG